jgi:hypothetical protein
MRDNHCYLLEADPRNLGIKHLDQLKYIYFQKRRKLEKLTLELEVIKNGKLRT